MKTASGLKIKKKKSIKTLNRDAALRVTVCLSKLLKAQLKMNPQCFKAAVAQFGHLEAAKMGFEPLSLYRVPKLTMMTMREVKVGQINKVKDVK